MATVPVAPLENSRLLDVREDVAALKADALGVKASHERLERDFAKLGDKVDRLADKIDKQNDKFDKQNEKFDKQNEKIEEIRGDLRDVKTTLKFVISILAPVGLIVLTQFAGFVFQHLQFAPASAGSALAQPAPAPQQFNVLSGDDIQKLKKLLDSQPSPGRR
jgi:hypothetical protein